MMQVDQSSEFEGEQYFSPKKALKESPDEMLKKMIAQVRPWLDKIDKIREVLGTANEVPISLPTIVVIGDQSSGKSSVLESISGVNLPKGGGCVTKCPLIMQLRTTEGEEYADIRTANEPMGEETKIDDLSAVADHIKTKTDDLTIGMCKISS